MVDVAGLTGDTPENLRDRQQCSTKGSQGSDQDHSERDGGVEETTRDSDRDKRWGSDKWWSEPWKGGVGDVATALQ